MPIPPPEHERGNAGRLEEHSARGNLLDVTCFGSAKGLQGAESKPLRLISPANGYVYHPDPRSGSPCTTMAALNDNSTLRSGHPVPGNEDQRIEALLRYGLLDTEPEESFDDFAHLASFICGTPIALVTLIDSDRQWFKAKVGISSTETPREQAFCAHTIMGEDLLMVEDALTDSRFATNPLVLSEPNIRFYAGAPLIDSDGFALGSLCVIDRKPRQLSAAERRALTALSRQLVVLCEYRRASASLASALESIKTLSGLLPICSHCKNVRNEEGYWRSVETYVSAHSDLGFSHGICPDCMRIHYPDIHEKLVKKGTA